MSEHSVRLLDECERLAGQSFSLSDLSPTGQNPRARTPPTDLRCDVVAGGGLPAGLNEPLSLFEASLLAQDPCEVGSKSR